MLSNGMEKTSHWAALYFVALMTFGNYVLFNLLVAILVEGFSSERNERREREQRELAKRRMSVILEASLRNSSGDSSRSLSSSSGSYIQVSRKPILLLQLTTFFVRTQKTAGAQLKSSAKSKIPTGKETVAASVIVVIA